MVLSYSAELAEEISYETRAIMQSEFYKEMTPTRIAKDRRKVNDFATTAGGRVRAVSIEGGVTGKGGDYIIIDDPGEIKDHDNLKKLQRVNDLFDGEIRTRLDHPKRGCILIIAHRIAEDDLVGHVLQQGGWKQLKLPLIAPRARTYELGNGRVWNRARGELLRVGTMSPTEVARLRTSTTKPSFETLYQQNPGGNNRLGIKCEHLSTTWPATLAISTLPVVLSVDPGQRGGPQNSYSVVQAWAICGNTYLLRDQWREQAVYRDFRGALYSFVRKYRPSVILIEATGQGPALSSDIRPQNGMQIVQIIPSESKVERLRRHRGVIRSGRVQLPKDAPWREDFINEVVIFPLCEFDDQVDAMTQFLDWASTNPTPKVRPAMPLWAGSDSRGVPMFVQSSGPTQKVNGAVLALNSRFKRR